MAVARNAGAQRERYYRYDVYFDFVPAGKDDVGDRVVILDVIARNKKEVELIHEAHTPSAKFCAAIEDEGREPVFGERNLNIMRRGSATREEYLAYRKLSIRLDSTLKRRLSRFDRARAAG